jgi:hypothetical protein
VMARAQKPDFVFRRNGRVNLNRRGASVQSTVGSRGVRISGSNAGYTVFPGSVKSTGYPLHSPVSPSLPLPYVTLCHHISTGLYPHFAVPDVPTATGFRNKPRWIMTGPPATHSFVLVSRSTTKRSPAQHFETIHGHFFPYFQGSCPYTCHVDVYCIEAPGGGEWSALRPGCFYSQGERFFGIHRLEV